jgi:hypothetical protein
MGGGENGRPMDGTVRKRTRELIRAGPPSHLARSQRSKQGTPANLITTTASRFETGCIPPMENSSRHISSEELKSHATISSSADAEPFYLLVPQSPTATAAISPKPRSPSSAAPHPHFRRQRHVTQADVLAVSSFPRRRGGSTHSGHSHIRNRHSGSRLKRGRARRSVGAGAQQLGSIFRRWRRRRSMTMVVR